MKKVTLLMALMLFCSWQMIYAQKTITGIVSDAKDGSTIPGVNVVVKGTTTGTVTDLSGAYSIKVPANAQALTFSFVGYTSVDVAVAGQSKIDVSLEPSAKQLEEVVVTALGIRRDQKALGYAISTVSSKELTKVGSTNFGTALYGKAAGVRVSAAPGGATSAVSINIRGINSITGNSQPLIIVDGIPIRNGEANNVGYWDDQRIRGNGLIDINNEDIENISILKGASASALYGSEGANGVVLITTKSGTGMKKGNGIEFNASYTFDNVAFLPEYQNTYGPGYDRGTNVSAGGDEDGWFTATVDGQEVKRPYFRAYGQFGPKFDGQQVLSWTGEMVPYNAQENNFKDFFQTGRNSMYNVAYSQGTEKANFRAAYTRSDNTGVQRGNDHNKNDLTFNGNFKISKKNTTDINFRYINQYTKNRSEKISRITNNYGGFFSRFDDMQWYYDNYATSKGYKYVDGAATASITPDENLKYRIRAYDLMEYMWRNNQNSYEEFNNRLIGSLTNTYEIINGVKVRGRIGTDYTSLLEITKNKNEKPLSLGNSGYYGQGNTLWNSLYGDLLLMVDRKLTDNIGIVANAGITGKHEDSYTQFSETADGLSVENWFNNNASVGTVRGRSSRWERGSFAYLGTLGLNYNSYLFLEGTIRRETFSTLPPASNTTVYPSVNTSFIFSEAFKLPDFIDYGKIRVSYGIVGVPAEMYKANVAYNQSGLNGIIYNNLSTSYGNEGIVPEEKREFEIGLETKYFKNRLSVDISYYNGSVIGQILSQTVPVSTGFSSMLANVGDLNNSGFEFAAYGTPIQTSKFKWDVRTNFGINKNKITKLADGLDILVHQSYDADAVRLLSKVGESMGDFYTYTPLLKDGKPVIEDGYYKIDFSEMKKVGNVTPKIVGGIASTLTYNNFFVDFAIDYRFGGEILSLGNHYQMGAGMFEQSMEFRDAEHGGAAYYVDGDGNFVATSGTAGPGGEKVYHDGVILDGVKADGTPNDVIIDAANYYLNTYTWGLNSDWAPMTRYDKSIYKNNYIKFREFSIGYNLPKNAISKIGFQNLTVSLIGSNLFYIYKTLPNADPEVSLGTQWIAAAVDSGSSAATRSFGISLRTSF